MRHSNHNFVARVPFYAKNFEIYFWKFRRRKHSEQNYRFQCGGKRILCV